MVEREPYKDPYIDLNLTQKQEKFAQMIAEGHTGTDASLAAFDVSSRASASSLAQKTMQKPHVMERIRQLRAEAEAGAIIDRRERQALLTSIALDEEASRSDRISALDKLNKMSGDYSETINHNANVSADVRVARNEAMEELLRKIGIEEVEDDSNEQPEPCEE